MNQRHYRPTRVALTLAAAILLLPVLVLLILEITVVTAAVIVSHASLPGGPSKFGLVIAVAVALLVLALAIVLGVGYLVANALFWFTLKQLRQNTLALIDLLSKQLAALSQAGAERSPYLRRAACIALARTHKALENDAEALKYLGSVRDDVFRSDPRADVPVLLEYGDTALRLGFWPAATDAFDAALSGASFLGDDELRLAAKLGFAKAHAMAGRCGSALELLRESETLKTAENGMLEAAWGYVYLEYGSLDEALRCLDEAERLYKEYSNDEELLRLLLMQGEAYSKLQKHSHALEACQKAAELAKRRGVASSEARALWGIAKSYQGLLVKIGKAQQRRAIPVRLAQALSRQWDSVVQSEPLAEGDGAERVSATLKRALNRRYDIETDEAARVVGTYGSWEATYRSFYLLYDLCRVRLRAAALECGITERATEGKEPAFLNKRFWSSFFTHGTAFEPVAEPPSPQLDSYHHDISEEHRLYTLARTLFPFDQSKANELMQRGIALIESRRSSIEDESIRLHHFAGVSPYYLQYIYQLMTCWRISSDATWMIRAFRICEHYRARQLLESLKGNINTWLEEEARQMVAELQAKLRPGECLIEFLLGDVESYVWLISAVTITAAVLPRRSVVESVCELVLGHCINKGYQIAASSADDRFTLERILVGKLPMLKDFEKVYVVPDGILAYCPFAYIVNSEPAGRHVQGKRMATAFLPAGAALEALRRRPAMRQNTIAIFADPVFSAEDDRLELSFLVGASKCGADSRQVKQSYGRLPNTTVEARRICEAAMNIDVRLFTGLNASRSTFFELDLTDVWCLHVATHCCGSGVEDRCKFLLSCVGANGQDLAGWVFDYEIESLAVSADLVVLSSCESATGPYREGEGMLGLARAFIQSGARCVVGALWKVPDDGTSELMGRFYELLLGDCGLSPAEALSSAQADIRRTPEWNEPYYWAGFAVLGDGFSGIQQSRP